MKTYSAIDVAAWFLDKAATDTDAVKDISNMKLQKLVFFSQLVSALTHADGTLHRDDTHAWDYGPVVPKLYRILRDFRGDPLSFSDPRVKEVFDAQNPEKIEDPEALGLLESVWAKFRNWTAVQLSALSHRRNSPWSVVYSQTPYEVITPAIMRKYGFGEA